MDRRQFLRRSAMVGGPRRPDVASAIPCPFTVSGLLQDGRGITDLEQNPFYAPQGANYRLSVRWTPQIQTTAGTENSAIFFRWVDSANHYRLNFFPEQVGLLKYEAGVHYDVGRAFRPIDPTHPARFTLVMAGATFSVKDDDQPGSPTILTWTDPNNTFPTGVAVIANTWPNCVGTWKRIKGTPT